MDPSNSPPPNSDGTSPPQANNRGRRPALIPYTDDLAALFAAGNYSPTSLGGNSATNGKAPLFVLPPLLPDGENPSMMVLPPPTWNGVELEDDTTACDWDSDDSEDESLQENREGRKAELRRSGAGLGDSDAMEVDEEDVREVEGDVASWVGVKKNRLFLLGYWH